MIFSFALASVKENNGKYEITSKGLLRTIDIRREIPQVSFNSALSDDEAGLFVLDELIKERVCFDPFLVKPGEKTAINSSYDNCVKASKEEILTSLEDNSDVDVFYFPYEALEDESQNEIMKAIVEAYPDSYVLVETDKKVPSWLCDKLNLLLTDNDALISDSYDTVLMKEGKFDLYKGKNMVSSQDSKKLFETLFTEGKFQGLDKFF